MRMLAAGIDAQIGHLLAAKTVARQHPLDRAHQNPLGVIAFQDFFLGARFDAAGIAGMPVIVFLPLFARDLDFFGIDDVFLIDAAAMTKMQSNIFSISDSVVVSEVQFTRLNRWLELQGFTVEAINFAEISKQGGLLRCSTLPLERHAK